MRVDPTRVTHASPTIGKVNSQKNAVTVKELKGQPKIGESDVNLSRSSGVDQGYRSETKIIANNFGDTATIGGTDPKQVSLKKPGTYNQWGQVAAHSQRGGESQVKRYQSVAL